MKGKQAAADRPHRDQHHRGVESAAARVPASGELDIANPVPPDLIGNVLDAGQQAQARARGAGRSRWRAASSRRSPSSTSTWRIRWSAATRRTGSRCAARSAWRTTPTTRSRIVRQGQALPATQMIPPNLIGHDPTFDGHAKFDLAGGEGAARQVRLRRPRRRRLARPAGRQAVHAADRVRAIGVRPAAATSCGRRA